VFARFLRIAEAVLGMVAYLHCGLAFSAASARRISLSIVGHGPLTDFRVALAAASSNAAHQYSSFITSSRVFGLAFFTLSS
jgi:hypothetical protein